MEARLPKSKTVLSTACGISSCSLLLQWSKPAQLHGASWQTVCVHTSYEYTALGLSCGAEPELIAAAAVWGAEQPACFKSASSAACFVVALLLQPGPCCTLNHHTDTTTPTLLPARTRPHPPNRDIDLPQRDGGVLPLRVAGGDFAQWLLIVMRGSDAQINQRLQRLLSAADPQEPRPPAINIPAGSGMDLAIPAYGSSAITAVSSSADTPLSQVYAVKLEHGIQTTLASIAAVRADTSGR